MNDILDSRLIKVKIIAPVFSFFKSESKIFRFCFSSEIISFCLHFKKDICTVPLHNQFDLVGRVLEEVLSVLVPQVARVVVVYLGYDVASDQLATSWGAWSHLQR